MDDETSSDDNIEDLLSQLQDVNAVANQHATEEKITLSKEQIEQFVIDSAGTLIHKSLGAVDDIKQFVLSAPDPEQIDSLAALIKSSATAIDTLNKIVLQDKKSETSKDLKELDFKQKKELQSVQDSQLSAALVMSREEMIKQLIDNADIIDADVTDTTPEK